jgi:pyridoxine 5'-phosphate synthase PdxJ
MSIIPYFKIKNYSDKLGVNINSFTLRNAAWRNVPDFLGGNRYSKFGAEGITIHCPGDVYTISRRFLGMIKSLY